MSALISDTNALFTTPRWHPLAETTDYLRQPHIHTAYTALRRSGLTAVFDNWFGVLGRWKWEDLTTWLGLRLGDIDRQNGVVVARTCRTSSMPSTTATSRS